MIARHEAQSEQTDVWARLAAPLPAGTTAWRQDGRAVARDGKYFARYVAYTDAGTVRERLDQVVPGEWNLTLELLPSLNPESDSFSSDGACAFKARLQILGVVREDIGTGKDYKQASTDAFKRAGVRFGIGHELYQLGANWVQMDGDGKYAKPIEDPQAAYDRRHARADDAGTQAAGNADSPALTLRRAKRKAAASTSDVPPCPKCGGKMWDNRIGKRNPRAPDFKCRDRSCDGVIWPPREAPAAQAAAQAASEAEDADAPQAVESEEIPF
ncbi:MAG TPA: Rad52/Rad22 family DNA repair protein [Gemmatimonadaceae bacterium]|nr:Rad52/Rad22 family DNA repair protein [Gemmatimonadaceae bacterium]